MRRAVERAFFDLTGQEAQACFSGWGEEFAEPARAVIENRMPVEEETPVRADIHAAALDLLAKRDAELARMTAENDLWRRNHKVIQDAIRQAFPVGPPFELPNWPYGDAALTPEQEGDAG